MGFFKLCVGYIFNFDIKKSLKIPKRKSESVIRRRTEKTMVKRKRADNTMVRRKSTKGQTTIYKKYVVNIKPTWESCHFKSHIDIAFYIVFIQSVFHWIMPFDLFYCYLLLTLIINLLIVFLLIAKKYWSMKSCIISFLAMCIVNTNRLILVTLCAISLRM